MGGRKTPFPGIKRTDCQVMSEGCGTMTATVQQESSTNKKPLFLFSLPEKSLEWWCAVKIGAVNCHFKVLSLSAEEVKEREKSTQLRLDLGQNMSYVTRKQGGWINTHSLNYHSQLLQ